MFNTTSISSIGLLLDIAGAVLIFKYGLPEKVDRDGAIYVVSGGEGEKEIQKAKKYDRWAKVGIVCLIIGFSLQLISNFLNA
jgi:hypothetical protein